MPEPGQSSRVLGGIGDLPRPFIENQAGSGCAEPAADEQAPDPVSEAYEKGHQAGLARGRQDAVEELEQQNESLRLHVSEALAELSELGERLNEQHKALMIELALEAASRILRQRITADDPVAARALAEAIDSLPSAEQLRARVHPDDLPSIQRELADQISSRAIDLVADEVVQRGGCIVESRLGTIDATQEAAVEAVRSAAAGQTEAV